MTLNVPVREDILTSWQRCVVAGLRPDRFQVPYQPDLDDDGPLRWAAAPILDQVADELEGTGVGLLLTDARGQIIDRRAADTGILTRLDHIELAPGFLYGENLIGTNAIGTAIAQQAPSVVTGPEHFADALTSMACAATPVTDGAGEMIGVIDLTCAAEDFNPLLLPFAKRAAREIGHRLSEVLANVAKHANAETVMVCVKAGWGVLGLSVRDDGAGGADPDGSGLTGLRERAEALGGTLKLTSPPGRGTRVDVRLPAAALGLKSDGDRDGVGDGRVAGDRRGHPGPRDSDLRVRPLGELLGTRRGPSCSCRRTVARIAERSLMAAERPLLVSSRLQDPEQKIQFLEGRSLRVAGGAATPEAADGVVYLVISVRNVGTGLAVMHGWHVEVTGQPQQTHPPLEDFTTQTRDIYVASGDIGFWRERCAIGPQPSSRPSPPQSRLATR